MSKREEYQKKLEAQLNEWGAEISKMKEKADKASGELKNEHTNQLEVLKEKHSDALEKLEELRKSGGEAWDDLKAGAEITWENLRKAVKTAASHFK